MLLSAAEKLLQGLGVTSPQEIDLDAIAYSVNAKVRYYPLDGCEAQIVGCGDNAIITVNNKAISARKRFSIAHELGHWHHHRGQCLVCRADDELNSKLAPERVANAYAADLLMPKYMFEPYFKKISKINLESISVMAGEFGTSRTATIIRIIALNLAPLMLVCHSKFGRRWFFRSSSIPTQWFPRSELRSDTGAFGVVFGNEKDGAARNVSASAWFECRDASAYNVSEQSLRIGNGEVVTLLQFPDRNMLKL